MDLLPDLRVAPMIRRFVAVAAVATCASGCQDLGQVAFLDARSPVAVGFGPISFDPPEPIVEGLIEERDVARALIAQGLGPEVIGALQDEVGDLRDLAAVEAAVGFRGRGLVVLTDLVLEDIEDDVVRELRDALDDEAYDAIELLGTDVGFSAWGDWLIDPANPNESLFEALTTREMQIDLQLRILSFRDLLAQEFDEDDMKILDDFIALDSLETLALKEIGLRTLFDDEVEPEEGFPDDEAEDQVSQSLIDRDQVGPCGRTQQVLDHPFAVTGRIIEGVGEERPVFAGDLDPPAGRCGLRAPPITPVDFRDHYDDPTVFVVSTVLTLDPTEVHIGGYVRAEIAARLSLPGSLPELGDLGDDED